MSFEIKTTSFEGPFDLLIFFIQRDEIDIYDIPIAKITNDFLDYLKHLEAMNIEVASEFILVAATLMSIKAKMLLPRFEKDEQGNEIDPREELVRHLLEYKKYKSVTEELSKWEDLMLMREERGGVEQELNEIGARYGVEIELQDVSLYRLLKAYQKAIDRYEQGQKEKPVHSIVPYPYTVEQQRAWVLTELEQATRLSFDEIVKKDFHKVALIFNFLAILELLAAFEITITIEEGYGKFYISKK